MTAKSRRVAIDTETTGLNPWVGDKPYAISAMDDQDRESFWEWPVDPFTREPEPPTKALKEVRALCSSDLVKDFFNLRFDALMLEAIGSPVSPLVWPKIGEVSFMARAVNSLEFAYKLKPLAKKYLSIADDDEKELQKATVAARRLARKFGWNLHEDVEPDYWILEELRRRHPAQAQAAGIKAGLLRKYAMRDAERTSLLSEFYRVGMKDLGVEATYEMEMRLLPLTMDMERHGVAIDGNRLRVVRKECERKLVAAKAILREVSGNPDFNVDSPKQVADLLFGGKPLSLECIGRTKKGQPKTDAEHLLPHRGNPIVEALLSCRSNGKAMSSFFRKYRELSTREEASGAIVLHPGYRQWGALTGRYTCSDPNLQQVSDPTTTNSRTADLVVNVRQVFIPRPGKRLYAPDYDQVEVIIFADVSGEPTMLDAIKHGVDIHTATTNKIWGGEGNPKAIAAAQAALVMHFGNPHSIQDTARFMEEHSWDIVAAESALGLKTHRKLAKAVTFTKVFGGKEGAVMSWTGLTFSESRAILHEYDTSFPTMRAEIARLTELGRKQGYVINKFGRRLTVDRFAAYRAVNYLVQSSAADLMKRGMLACSAYLRSAGLDARIVLTVHDELIFEFSKAHATRRVLRELCRRMADHGGAFSVPTPVSMDAIDERWSEKRAVEL